MPGHHLDELLDTRVPDGTWLEELLPRLPDAKAGVRPCPSCSTSMEVVRWPGTEVSVDRCPKACGGWVDAGEVDRLVAHRRDVLAETPPETLVRAMAHEIAQLARGEEPPEMVREELGELFRLLSHKLWVGVPGVAAGAGIGERHG
jgi:Zn-finger nucleic acid-binding protein